MTQDEERLAKLLQVADGASSVLIVIQDMPDPDAIASAEALSRLLLGCCGIVGTVAHQGIVARAENRGLVRYLKMSLAQLSDVNPAAFDLLATVDTQPSFTNNSLPPDAKCDIIIDHHTPDGSPRARFTDIRPECGATSTILARYLQAAGTPIDVHMATALLYGIKSDTQDLGRESTRADTDAYVFLYMMADRTALSRIEHESVPPGYFQTLHAALEGSYVYDHVLVCCTGDTEWPEMIAEVSDLLLRLEGIDYVLCYGTSGSEMLLSLRTSKARGKAYDVIRKMVAGIGSGGGHEMIAGGQVSLDGAAPEDAAEMIVMRFLEHFHLADRQPVRLVRTEEESDGISRAAAKTEEVRPE